MPGRAASVVDGFVVVAARCGMVAKVNGQPAGEPAGLAGGSG
jgi:hypothetical protein